jgi:hypothetical protein
MVEEHCLLGCFHGGTPSEIVFFDNKFYPFVERMVNSDSAVKQLWNPIIRRNPEDGDVTFPET